jgi:hypothetical protein
MPGARPSGRLTANGRLDSFSSQFTRTAGLEVVQPLIGSLIVATAPTVANPACTLAWDCRDNPSGTTVTLQIISPSGAVTLVPSLPLQGTHTFSAAHAGTFVAVLQASLTRNGETRQANQALQIVGV